MQCPVPRCLWALSWGYSKSPLIISAIAIGCVKDELYSLYRLIQFPLYKHMWGYQLWPCHSTPAPGGSDRYSLCMTVGSFCISKAILIHDPVNTNTRGFASAPPPLFGCLFSSVIFFLFVHLVRKIAVKLSFLSGNQHCARLDGRNNEGSVGGGASTDAEVLSWWASSVAANQAALRPPAERMASVLCFWDNQTTRLLHPEGSLCSLD